MEGISPAFADPDESKGLVADQLPDIEGIYKKSFTLPSQAAGADIQSLEIRSYYQQLIAETGLDK